MLSPVLPDAELNPRSTMGIRTKRLQKLTKQAHFRITESCIFLGIAVFFEVISPELAVVRGW
jgi:hypothetical protein